MSKSRIAIVLAILAALAAGGAIVWAAMKDAPKLESSSEPTTEQVRIEIRAMPVATIRVDGKAVGKTPLSLQYPKSNREVVVEATMKPNIYDAKTGRPVAEPVTETRKVRLDDNHLLDFTVKKPKINPELGEEPIEVDPKDIRKPGSVQPKQ